MSFVQVVDGTWIVPKYYTISDVIGRNRYGMICKAMRGENVVAIKKIEKLVQDKYYAKRANRELELLRQLRHPNILEFYDAFTPDSDPRTLKNIYVVTKYEPWNLETILADTKRQGQHLSIVAIKELVYQLLCGLNYMHSAEIIHRDIRPANLVIDQNWKLKILGFDLNWNEESLKTGYVGTKEYRAPEIMFNWQNYNQSDIWSVACIMAEMFTGTLLFPANNCLEHLALITNLCGLPDEAYINLMKSEETKKYILNMQKTNKGRKQFSQWFRGLPEEAIAFLDCALIFETDRRITANEALTHSFFQEVRNHSNETRFIGKFNIEKESLSLEKWMHLIWNKAKSIHLERERVMFNEWI